MRSFDLSYDMISNNIIVIDGLLVAMAVIKERVKKLKFAKRIFLVTDVAGPINDDPDAMNVYASPSSFHCNGDTWDMNE